MKTLGVGLIGTGYMGKCHALAWNSVSAVFGGELKPQLVTLAEVNEDLAKQRARDFGFKKATGNWRDLLADPEIDIISITTPNHFHREMAVAALEADKHVYCEKPMATKLEDAEAMLQAARASGKQTFLGYNYIQNPMTRRLFELLKAGEIGDLFEVRIEMDEDYMANPADLWGIKSDAASGYGALDDFGVHPLSLLYAMGLYPKEVLCHMSKPYATRKDEQGEDKTVETFDSASVLVDFGEDVSGTLLFNRAAWGRKGRIAIQLYGSKGSIVYDQERMNELWIYKATGEMAGQGYTTMLAGPAHEPYNRFIPAPGHGLGFNELKTIEVHELLKSLQGQQAHILDFERGLKLEQAVHAMARSYKDRKWTAV